MDGRAIAVDKGPGGVAEVVGSIMAFFVCVVCFVDQGRLRELSGSNLNISVPCLAYVVVGPRVPPIIGLGLSSYCVRFHVPTRLVDSRVGSVATVFHGGSPVILRTRNAVCFAAFAWANGGATVLSFSLRQGYSYSQGGGGVFAGERRLKNVVVFFRRCYLIPCRLDCAIVTAGPCSSLLVLECVDGVVEERVVVFFLRGREYGFAVRVDRFAAPISVLPRPSVAFAIDRLMTVRLFVFPAANGVGGTVFLRVVAAGRLNEDHGPWRAVFVFFRVTGPVICRQGFVSALEAVDRGQVPIVAAGSVRHSRPGGAFTVLVCVPG